MFGHLDRIKITDRIDHLAKQLDQQAIADALGDEMVLESVTLEDLENTLLFSCEPVPSMILEALKSKASMLESRVKKFANQISKKLDGIDVTGIEIGKPRKSGAVAIQIAKIGLSDGQSISIAFHAPDNDPLKINSDDTLIAFRFLLNSRDVTHTVAPKGNNDLSVKEATSKLGQLVSSNSAKFTAAQAKKTEDAQALEVAQQKAVDLEEQGAKLTQEADGMASELASAEKRIAMLQKQVDTQNEIQEELRKQLAKKAVEPSGQGNESGKQGTSSSDTSGSQDQSMVSGVAVETLPLSSVKTDSLLNPTIKAGAVKGDDAIWYRQGKLNPLGGKARQALEIRKVFEEAGFKEVYYKHSRLQGIYVLENAAGQVVTNKGYEAVAASIENGSDDVAPMDSAKTKLGNIANSIVDAIQSGMEKNVRSQLPNHLKSALHDVIVELESAGFTVADNDQVAQVQFAKDSLYADTALNELVNGGWADASLLSGASIGDDYDPSDEYNPDNSIKGIHKFAKEFGVSVVVKEDMPDYEDMADSVIRVQLKKNDETAYMQIQGDGKMAVFDSNGERLSSFGRYSFFSLYSNDDGTLRERIEAFSLHSETAQSSEDDTQEDAQQSDSELYWYGLRARPYGMSTTPNDATVQKVLNAEDAAKAFPNAGDDVRHGAIGYASPLTEKQVSDFELRALSESGAFQFDEEFAEMIVRQAVLDWMDFKEISAITQSDYATLKQQVQNSTFKATFASMLRKQPEYLDRKKDISEFKEWNETVKAVSTEFFGQVVESLNVIASDVVASDDADEAAKGKTEDEQKLLDLNASDFNEDKSDSFTDVKSLAATVRAVIAKLKRDGKLPKSVTLSAKINKSVSGLDVSITGMGDDIRLYSDAYLQLKIDNPHNVFLSNEERYSPEVANLMAYINKLVHQYQDSHGDAMTDSKWSNFLFSGVQVDYYFDKQRLVDELESFTEIHAQGVEADKQELDVNGLRDSLDANGKLMLEQLEEFTDFKIQLGKQTLALFAGMELVVDIRSESDFADEVNDAHAVLAESLKRKAKDQLSVFDGWVSKNAYYAPDGTQSELEAAHGIQIDKDKLSTPYAYSDQFVPIFHDRGEMNVIPVYKNKEFKFAVYNHAGLVGEASDVDDIEMLAIMAMELTSEAPQGQKKGEEVTHISKIEAIRDFTGELTLELEKQFTKEIEEAAEYFAANDLMAENEDLLNAAVTTIATLQ